MSTSVDASRNRMRTTSAAARTESMAPRMSTMVALPKRRTSAIRSKVEPGAAASSPTLGTRAGGTLSMTNHPRSSRSEAARDPPAPLRPQMTRNSALTSAHPSSCTGEERTDQVDGDEGQPAGDRDREGQGRGQPAGGDEHRLAHPSARRDRHGEEPQ